MSKPVMIYLKYEDAENIELLGKQNGLPLATMARSLLIQKLREVAPISAGKQNMGAEDTPNKGVPL